jgi:chromosomal replication initiation ATPase DnaA
MSLEAELRQRYIEAHHRLTQAPAKPKLLPKKPKPKKQPEKIVYFRLLSMDWILNLVCADNGIMASGVKAQCRTAKIVKCRQLFCHLASLAGHSHSSIGRFIGKDHTTVTHAINTMTRCNPTQVTAYEELVGKQIRGLLPVLCPQCGHPLNPRNPHNYTQEA